MFHFRYIFGLDHTNTKISLLIKVLLFAELGAAELQLQKEINDAETRILTNQYSLGRDISLLLIKALEQWMVVSVFGLEKCLNSQEHRCWSNNYMPDLRTSKRFEEIPNPEPPRDFKKLPLYVSSYPTRTPVP